MVPTMYLAFVISLYQGLYEVEVANENVRPTSDVGIVRLVAYVLVSSNAIFGIERRIGEMAADA